MEGAVVCQQCLGLAEETGEEFDEKIGSNVSFIFSFARYIDGACPCFDYGKSHLRPRRPR